MVTTQSTNTRAFTRQRGFERPVLNGRTVIQYTLCMSLLARYPAQNVPSSLASRLCMRPELNAVTYHRIELVTVGKLVPHMFPPRHFSLFERLP